VLLRAIHNITNTIQIQPKIIPLQWYNMAPRRPKQPLISTAWAESLIGLSMRVPEYWWPGYNGYRLHDGMID
jgi:hypothetical protein